MTQRKHAELIKAWADGATIERLWNDFSDRPSAWLIDNEPDWSEFEEYRIKLEQKLRPKSYVWRLSCDVTMEEIEGGIGYQVVKIEPVMHYEEDSGRKL